MFGSVGLIGYLGYDLRWVGGYISTDRISDEQILDFKNGFHVFDLSSPEDCEYLKKHF